MKKKKQPEDAPAVAEWLNTYCDMVTLLFAFFVLMFAMSQVDEGKFDVMVYVLGNRDATEEDIESFMAIRFGDDDLTDLTPEELLQLIEAAQAAESQASDDWEPIHKEIVDAILAAGMADRVSAYLGADFIFINFVGDVLFGPNSAALLPQVLPLVDGIGNILLDIEDEIGMIRVNGHTAAIPDLVGVYHVSDRILSSERADAVVMRFEDVIGIEGRKLTALSYGKNFPLPDADNNTDEGRARNRRIEILITQPQTHISIDLGTIYADLGTVPDQGQAS
jgi:chemotaxis protein MotB